MSSENDAHYKLREYAATLERPENPDIYGREGLYMSKYIVQKFPKGSRYENCDVRLNWIVRPDEDLELHDHPWGNRDDPEAAPSRALILFGGYEEERRIGTDKHWRIVRRNYEEGDTNTLYGSDFHRIHRLFNPLGSWSLFWLGPYYKSWQFWNRETNIYTPWRDFVKAKEEA